MRAATHSALPDDVAALRALVIDLHTRLQSRDDALQAREAQLEAGQQELLHLRTWIDKLKLEIARLKRMQFGRSAEQLGERIAQLELLVEDVEASTPLSTPAAVVPRTPARKPVRKPLPEHLPRETVIHSPADACPDCGTPMRRIGVPQSGQASAGEWITVSRGRCSGKGLRTGLRAGGRGTTAAGVDRGALASASSTSSSSCAMRSPSFSEERPNCMRRSRAISSLSLSTQVRRCTNSCWPASSCASRACNASSRLCSRVCRSITSARSAATSSGSAL